MTRSECPAVHGELAIQWQDAQGKWLPGETRRASRLPPGGAADWQRLAVYAPVPAGAGRLSFGVFVFSQRPDETLAIDDASLRLVPADLPPP